METKEKVLAPLLSNDRFAFDVYSIVPYPNEVFIGNASDTYGPRVHYCLGRNFLDRDRDVRRDVRLRVLTVVHLEPQMVLALPRAVAHHDHSRGVV